MKITKKDNEVVRHELTTETSGSIVISHFIESKSKALFTMRNPKGLGFSTYIYNETELNERINSINNIKWLDDVEKKDVINVLKTL